MKKYTIQGRIKNSSGFPDEITKEFTDLVSRSVKVRDVAYYQTLLSGLKLNVYKPSKCALESPTRSDLESQLSYIGSQKYFKLFGSNDTAIEKYVADEIEEAILEREKGYSELVSFFNQLEADKEQQANQKYLEEYNKQKSEKEAYINGESQYVENAIEQLFNNNGLLQIPFNALVQIDYNQSQQSARVDVEISLPLSIPTEKSSISPTYGRVSLKPKLVRERDDEFSKTIIGMTYLFAGHTFNLTANIKTVEVCVWERGRINAYLFIRFVRSSFSNLNYRLINPLQSIFDNDYVCDIKIVRGGTHIEPIEPNEFKKKISLISSNSSTNSNRSNVTSSQDNNKISLEDCDYLLVDVAEYCLNEGHISTSMIQRRFCIGYNRARSIVDQMENLGIVVNSGGEFLVNEDKLSAFRKKNSH